MRRDPIETGRRFVDECYPDAHAAIVGGSVIRGQGTATSDLDIVIVTDREEAPFRASHRFDGVPIEAFVHTEASLPAWIATDGERGRPSLAMMCAEGVVLRDRDGVAERVKRDAREFLDQGPEPLSPEQVEDWRYSLTDLLDDFLGCEDPREGVFIAHALAVEAADLLLLLHRQWRGAGKWVPRALARYNREAADRLVEALAAYHQNRNKGPLVGFAEEVLGEAGGRLFEGYCRRAPK